MSGHTPGPWHACAGDDCPEMLCDGRRAYFPHVHLGPDDHGRTYVGADGHTYVGRPSTICINSVSREGREGGASMPEFDANARLIAAAPEMLGALRETLVFLAILANAGNIWAERTAAQVRSAIAKAEGKQP